MSAVLVEYNRLYTNERKQQEGESSWWNNFGTFIGNMFVGDEEKRKFLKYYSSNYRRHLKETFSFQGRSSTVNSPSKLSNFYVRKTC